MEGTIYIDGQPVEGISQIDLEPVEASDMPDDVPNVADAAELTITIPPDWSEQIVNNIAAAVKVTAQVIRGAFARAAAAIQEWVTMLKNARDHFIDSDSLLYMANDHPKWWHLYKYAKKARTRKKYRAKLERQLISKMQAAAEG